MATISNPNRGSAMRTISRRSLLAHKVRLLLTLLAVVLGTAFISGSFIFTNTLNKSFDGIVDVTFEETDAVMYPQDGRAPVLPASLRDKILAHPDVAAVTEQTPMQIALGDPQGKRMETGGAPAQIYPYYPPDQQVESRTLIDGSVPTKPGEATLAESAAQRGNISLGDTITVVTPLQRIPMTVTGIEKIPTDVGGWIGVGVVPEQFREISGGAISSFAIRGKEGISRDDLQAEVQKAFPGTKVKTSDAAKQSVKDDVQKALKFINYFLLAFGAIALFVGTFIIANTFSMIVAQRIKEFALLRAVGASRRQITQSVVVEAIFIGIIGSLIGIVCGVGLVKALGAILDKTGFGLPSGGTVFGWQSIVFPVVIGIIVTVLSAWAPARRAGRVHPVQAMRTGATEGTQSLGRRTVLGTLALIAGVTLCLFGYASEDFSATHRLLLIGLGAALVIIGTLLVSALLAALIVPRVGKLWAIPFGSIGTLAATNSARNPRRSAATAFSLSLGLTLICLVGMMGASTKASIENSIEDNMTTELMVVPPPPSGGIPFGLPSEAMKKLADDPRVESTAAFALLPTVRIGQPGDDIEPLGASFVSAAPKNIDQYWKMDLRDGSANLTADGVFVTEGYAERENLKVGDSIDLFAYTVGADVDMSTGHINADTANNALQDTQILSATGRVIGITANKGFGTMSISDELAKKLVPTQSQWLYINYFLDLKDGTDIEAAKTELQQKVDEYIIVSVLNREEFQKQQSSQVDGLMGILYGLLGLSIVIAIIGIINTLALSIIERRQEIGMLRAVGMLRSQIRRMIYIESTQIALFGATSGVAVGLFLGWAFISVLKTQGLTEVAVPWTQIVITFLASGIVGVVAAIWPAVRAARTSPLEAIAD